MIQQPPQETIEIQQDNDRTINVTWESYNSITNEWEAINLTGYTSVLTVRKSQTSTPIINIVVDTFAAPTTGVASFEITNDLTGLTGTYIYDLLLVSPTGEQLSTKVGTFKINYKVFNYEL